MNHRFDPVVELYSGTVLFPQPLADMENPLGARPCFLATHSRAFLEALELAGEPAQLAIHPMQSQQGQTSLLMLIQVRQILSATIANLAEPAVQSCLAAGIADESITLHSSTKWGGQTVSLPVDCPREYLQAWLDHGQELKRFTFEERLGDLMRSIDWLKHHAVMLKSPQAMDVKHVSICGIISTRKD